MIRRTGCKHETAVYDPYKFLGVCSSVTLVKLFLVVAKFIFVRVCKVYMDSLGYVAMVAKMKRLFMTHINFLGVCFSVTLVKLFLVVAKFKSLCERSQNLKGLFVRGGCL